jgi:hypothetical protein
MDREYHPADTDGLIVERANRLRLKQLAHCSGIDPAVRVPSLFQLYDHEGFRCVITDATNEAASRRIRAYECRHIKRAWAIFDANGNADSRGLS